MRILGLVSCSLLILTGKVSFIKSIPGSPLLQSIKNWKDLIKQIIHQIEKFEARLVMVWCGAECLLLLLVLFCFGAMGFYLFLETAVKLSQSTNTISAKKELDIKMKIAISALHLIALFQNMIYLISILKWFYSIFIKHPRIFITDRQLLKVGK